MKTILFIVILVAASSIDPLILKLRERGVRKLAKEFKLRFHSQPPTFSDFYFKFLILSKEREINHVEGKINNHFIIISDVIFPSPWWIFTNYIYYRRYTVIQIDGETVKGRYKSFKLGDTFLTPVYTLRKILRCLDNKS